MTASGGSGDVNVDLRDPDSIAAMYQQVGRVDAVASAAGKAPYKPLGELALADLETGIADKLLGQVELVPAGRAARGR